jgi:hypothetical protein
LKPAAQARVLEKSLKETNPLYDFFLCLVDLKDPNISYPNNTIECNKIGISNFEGMVLDYNIIELNTAVKPYFFQYLFRINPDTEHVFYFDPDIKIYNSLTLISTHFKDYSILLTPHSLTALPIEDELFPKENLFLNHGVFNLGFLGLKNSDQSASLLKWWADRLKRHCIINLKEGYFVDQLWMNLVPLYYPDDTLVLRSYGNNVAYWNLHERDLVYDNGEFLINNELLMFFHFSGYSPKNPDVVAKNQSRIQFGENEYLKELFKQYHDELAEMKYMEISAIEPYYVERRRDYLKNIEIDKRRSAKGLFSYLVRKIINKARLLKPLLQ